MGFSDNIEKLTNKFDKSQISDFFKNWLNLNRWVVFLYLIIISAAAILYVSNVQVTTSLLKDIREMERVKEKLVNNNKLLNSKIKKLESPERIIPIAKNKLNMKIADKAPQTIIVNAEED